jgi:TetR/AcrR family transcriptional repressor of nem operon
LARHREFDQNEVLDRALEAFWDRGYEATSIQELTRCTGLHRGSLYNAFRDKQALFIAALERYERVAVQPLLEALERPGSPRSVIDDLYQQLVGDGSDATACRGCLLTNTAVERAPHDTQSAARVAAAFGKVEGAFHRLFLRGQAAGELSGAHDPHALARFFTSTLQGLRVMARAGTPPAALREIARISLTTLD